MTMLFRGNILVTGATGFLGARVVERLLNEHVEGRIIAAGRQLKPHNHLSAPTLEYKLGNLSDRDYVKSLFTGQSIRFVINCAGLSSPWGSFEAFYQANVLSVELLINEATKAGVERFIHISSPAVYSDFTDKLQVKESDPIPEKKVNAYSETKWMSEEILRKSTVPWITIRPRVMIGRWDTVLMPRAIRAGREGNLMVIGDGKNLTDLTPVSNVVDAILLALDASPEALYEDYNISSGDARHMWDLLRDGLSRLGIVLPDWKVPVWLAMGAAAIMEFWSKWFKNGQEPALTRYSVGSVSQSFTLDISKARRLLGYEPDQTVDEAVEEFFDWYMETEEASETSLSELG